MEHAWELYDTFEVEEVKALSYSDFDYKLEIYINGELKFQSTFEERWELAQVRKAFMEWYFLWKGVLFWGKHE